MIPRKNLIPLRTEFARIRKTGKMLNSPSFGLIVSYGSSSIPQCAFIVSKKVSPSSVIRHQTKRKLSDAVAPLFPKLPVSIELVFLVKKEAINKTSQELTYEISRLIFH